MLLLDEPASGLDPRARIEMRALLKELRTMGKTILVSSHILPELAELCTWVGFIDAGRMAAAGPMAEVRDAVVSGRRLRISLADHGEEEMTRAEELLRGHEGVLDVARLPDHLEVAVTESVVDDDLLALLVSRKVRVRSFAVIPGDLSEVFLRLTPGRDVMTPWRRLAEGLDNPIVVKEGVSRMRTWRAPVVATLYVSLIGAVGFAWLNLGEAGGRFSDGRPVAAVVGSQAFAAMSFFQLGLVCLFAPALAAGAISGGAGAADSRRTPRQPGVCLRHRLGEAAHLDGLHPAAHPHRAAALLRRLPLRRDRPPAVRVLTGRDDRHRALPGRDGGLFSALFQRSLAATVSSYASAFVLTVGTAILSFIISTSQTFEPGARGERDQLPGRRGVVFQPLLRALQRALPNPATQVTLRQLLQLLIFGVPPPSTPPDRSSTPGSSASCSRRSSPSPRWSGLCSWSAAGGSSRPAVPSSRIESVEAT